MYKKIIVIASVITGTVILGGCDIAKKQSDQQKDKEHQRVEQLIKTKILKNGETLPVNPNGTPNYLYGFADLNGDKQDEVLILMQNRDYCGSGGCTSFLFDHNEKEIAKFTVMDRPILLGNESSNGWRNIIVYSNGSMRLLQYSEKGYPSNPSMAPKYDYEQDQKVAVGLAMESSYYQENGTNLEPTFQQPIFDCQSCYVFSYETIQTPDKTQYLQVDVATKKVTPLDAHQ